MLAIEEMQSQQRAENGIKEIIIGYVGVGPVETELEEMPMDMIKALGSKIEEKKVAELPEHIRDIFLAEQHRLATGELLSIEQDKKRREELK